MAAIKTLFIHGFDFREGETAEPQYRRWRKFAQNPAYPWSWVSRCSIWQAWKTGHATTYYWAWSKALVEARSIASFLDTLPGQVDIVCHSLGSRVAYEVCRLRPDRIRYVLTFHGADGSTHARECALAAPKVRFYSVKTKEDKILRWLGQIFTPVIGIEELVGYHPMEDAPANWNDIWIGEEYLLPGMSSHQFSFTNEALHPRWRTLLS